MKLSSITSVEVAEHGRFDSKFHLSRQNPALQKLRSGRWMMRQINDIFEPASIWNGNIFGRIYAADKDHGMPLLVPYDVFRYLPHSNKILSRTQVPQFDRLRLKRGSLLIVCSGRNLGPVTIVDKFCERFVMSHDMVRIDSNLSDNLFYLAAFLSTSHGQATIRTDMSGSVIDHTDAKQVGKLGIPIVDDALKDECAAFFRIGFEKREKARLLLEQTQKDYLNYFGLGEPQKQKSSEEHLRLFSVLCSELAGRIDAEPYLPRYKDIREDIQGKGGCPLSDIADVSRPASRYKTNYVDDIKFGLPMMNGRQIAQYRAIALRSMSLSAFKKPELFALEKGMTLVTADGRAEENLADCALVSNDRVGWCASGHVHRVRPRQGINAGLVYLACASPPVQAQLKALATGSVVDGLSESDVASVIVPYDDSAELVEIGSRAEIAWRMFAEASESEDRAIDRLEHEFDRDFVI